MLRAVANHKIQTQEKKYKSKIANKRITKLYIIKIYDKHMDILKKI
jgi:hypothetical protein